MQVDPVSMATPVLMFLAGLLIKYNQKLAGIANDLIPWINVVLGVITQMAAGTVANAAPVISVGDSTLIPTGGTPIAAAGVLATIAASFWNSMATSLFYKIMAMPLLEKVFGLKKAVAK